MEKIESAVPVGSSVFPLKIGFKALASQGYKSYSRFTCHPPQRLHFQTLNGQTGVFCGPWAKTFDPFHFPASGRDLHDAARKPDDYLAAQNRTNPRQIAQERSKQ